MQLFAPVEPTLLVIIGTSTLIHPVHVTCASDEALTSGLFRSHGPPSDRLAASQGRCQTEPIVTVEFSATLESAQKVR